MAPRNPPGIVDVLGKIAGNIGVIDHADPGERFGGALCRWLGTATEICSGQGHLVVRKLLDELVQAQLASLPRRSRVGFGTQVSRLGIESEADAGGHCPRSAMQRLHNGDFGPVRAVPLQICDSWRETVDDDICLLDARTAAERAADGRD
ncbi:hypothetical protein [Microlunatus parietis]|uniref:Uncharacterized protein n=1 Tax=Microlunatus parietis TaxID=682979 RepID=A0A7Y9I6J7_9ACTN|nr:hypothetical protein [Microlunatus parietis]NYE70926.1 hypothetical protein [Microlunatus parietis]